MLCLPGFTPVWNVDQATGEIGGTVVPSGLKQPWSRSAARWGSLPSSSIFSVRPWSMPSRPRITTRLTRLRRSARQPKSVRDSRRTGQVRTVKNAEKTAAKTAKNEPASAKPGPGTDVGVGRARDQQHQERDQQRAVDASCFIVQSFLRASASSRLPSSSTVLPGFRSLPASPG